MLRRLRLENFKRFSVTEVELRPFTVLMGENGSGKTSILQALALGMRLLTTTDLVTYDPGSGRVRVRKKGTAFSNLPGFLGEDASEIFYAKRARGGKGGGTTPIRIELFDDTDNTYRLEITSQFGAFNVKCVSKQADFPNGAPLTQQRPVFLAGFVGLPPREERLLPLALEDRLVRGRASDILRNLLFDVAQASVPAYQELRELILREFAFDLGTPDFSQEKDLFVHANYLEPVERQAIRLDLSTAGSGFLQVLQILAPIYRYVGVSRVILLDEPDAHLHPNLQRTVARVLRQLALEKDLQIILSTHSTFIIQEAEPDSVIPVSSRQTKLVPLASTEGVESEIASRLDNFVLAKARVAKRLLFLEDRSNKILKRVDELLRTGLFAGPGAPPLLASTGKDDKVPFLLSPILNQLTGVEVEVFFLRDGDGLPQDLQDKIRAYADSKGVRLVLLPFHEIENVLLRVDLLWRAMVAKEVSISHQEVAEIVRETMGEVIARSKYGFELNIRDCVYKTYSLVGESLTWQQAEAEARRIRAAYEELTSFDDLWEVAPGKEVLKEVRRRLSDQRGIQITDAALVRHLREDDLPLKLCEALRQLSERAVAGEPALFR